MIILCALLGLGCAIVSGYEFKLATDAVDVDEALSFYHAKRGLFFFFLFIVNLNNIRLFLMY